MNFCVETIYTEEDFIAGAEANWVFSQHLRRASRVLGTIGRVAAVPVGAISVFLLFMSVWAGFNALGLVLGVLFAILTRWIWQSGTPAASSRKLGKAIWEAYEKKGQTVRFRFDEDSLQAFEGGEAASYRYPALTDAAQSRERFVLCLSQGTYFILKKSDFIQGDPAEFADFLTKKMGKPLQNIK